MSSRQNGRIVLWGFHRRDRGYAFITAESADRGPWPIVGVHDMRRWIVTVVR